MGSVFPKCRFGGEAIDLVSERCKTVDRSNAKVVRLVMVGLLGYGLLVGVKEWKTGIWKW